MTGRMFIVDDEPSIVELCKVVLQRRGFTVVGSALDGEEAVSKFRGLKDGADMILLDYRMPRKNGLETLSALLNIDPDIKVLFMSADTSIIDVALRDGAAGFLVKPFEISELIDTIKKILRIPEDGPRLSRASA